MTVQWGFVMYQARGIRGAMLSIPDRTYGVGLVATETVRLFDNAHQITAADIRNLVEGAVAAEAIAGEVHAFRESQVHAQFGVKGLKNWYTALESEVRVLRTMDDRWEIDAVLRDTASAMAKIEVVLDEVSPSNDDLETAFAHATRLSRHARDPDA